MKIGKINKKGQGAGGFAIILPIVISLMVAGFVLTVMTKVNSDIAGTDKTTNVSRVGTNVNQAAVSFAGNFGTFFSLALLAVIIGIVAIFLVRRG